MSEIPIFALIFLMQMSILVCINSVVRLVWYLIKFDFLDNINFEVDPAFDCPVF